jgi:hypothetical protein
MSTIEKESQVFTLHFRRHFYFAHTKDFNIISLKCYSLVACFLFTIYKKGKRNFNYIQKLEKSFNYHNYQTVYVQRN